MTPAITVIDPKTCIPLEADGLAVAMRADPGGSVVRWGLRTWGAKPEIQKCFTAAVHVPFFAESADTRALLEERLAHMALLLVQSVGIPEKDIPAAVANVTLMQLGGFTEMPGFCSGNFAMAYIVAPGIASEKRRGHSMHRYAPCSPCGDLDGCHLWREAPAEVKS